MRRFAIPVLAAMLALPAAATAAQAAPARQSVHDDWEVYTDAADGGRVCFAVTRPVGAVPRAMDHDEVYFLVSSWSGGRRSQPSFHAGYPLSAMRAPVVEIAPRDFRSYADADEAFLPDDAEPGLIEAMRRGASMRVEAQTENGERAYYEFSLMGVSAAMREVEALC